jgi:hypothetical protein
MPAPSVNVFFGQANAPFTDQDFTAIPLIIGNSSAGTKNVVTPVLSDTDVSQFGFGSLPSLLQATRLKSNGIVYAVRSDASTAATTSSVSKIIGNPVGAPVTIGTGNASMIFTAKQTGLSVTILQGVGNATATSATFVAGLLTITLGTDGGGTPNGTPNAVKTVLDGIAGVGTAMLYVVGGTGAGVMATAANTLLPFGSSGAATVAGTATDTYSVTVVCVFAGTVGQTPAPRIQWSCDGAAGLYTGVIPVPTSGIIALADSKVDTGITITLTGVLDVGDKFNFTTTEAAPTVGDIAASIDAALLDTTKKWGFATCLFSATRANVTLLAAKIQAVKSTQFKTIKFATRDIGEGVNGETEAAWANAITADFAGYLDPIGLEDVVPGTVVDFVDPYTNRTYKRPALFENTILQAMLPGHETISQLPLQYSTKASYGNTSAVTLLDQRFQTIGNITGDITKRFLLTPTMADVNNKPYDRRSYVNVLLFSGYIAFKTGFQFMYQNMQGIPVAESATIPAGALSQADANRIETVMAAALREYWNKLYPGYSKPAVDFENPVSVARNYNFSLDRGLRVNVGVKNGTQVEKIDIYVTPKIA